MNFEQLPIPESDLLDYVEGQLSGTRRVEVAALLRTHPELARLVAGMQDDRRAASGLARVSAPVGILEGVEARLEREALLGLSTVNGQAGAGELRVSAVVPEESGVIARISRSVWGGGAGRKLALAAAGLVVAGAAVWVVQSAVQGMRGPQRIVRKDDGAGEPVAPGGGPVEGEGSRDAMANAGGGAVPDGAGAGTPNDGTGEAAKALASAAGLMPDDGSKAVAEDGADDPMRITAARALELARQGRLAVVVRCADTGLAAKRIERLATPPTGRGEGEAVRVAKLEAGALPRPMMALAGLWTARPAAPGVDAAPTTVAGERGPVAANETARPAAAAAAIRAVPAAVYAVEVDDAESSMAGLRAAISTSGMAGARVTAEFIRLDESIEIAPSVDPSAVLWWGGPTARWVWRWSVPVVVQPAR